MIVLGGVLRPPEQVNESTEKSRQIRRSDKTVATEAARSGPAVAASGSGAAALPASSVCGGAEAEAAAVLRAADAEDSGGAMPRAAPSEHLEAPWCGGTGAEGSTAKRPCEATPPAAARIEKFLVGRRHQETCQEPRTRTSTSIKRGDVVPFLLKHI